MARQSRSEEEIVEDLLAQAIPNGECLECHLRPSIDDRGRERHFVSVGGRYGTKWRTSRLVYSVIKGEIPNDRVILHTCDNLKCLNPNHLVMGTWQDNTQDMMTKGRHKYIRPDNKKANGDRIRELYSIGLTLKEIGV